MLGCATGNYRDFQLGPQKSKRFRRGYRFGRQSRFRNPFAGRTGFTDSVYPRPQVKCTDVPISQTLTNGGFVFPINREIYQTDESGIVGIQISMKNCYWQYVVTPGSTPVPAAVRVMLVWDKQPNSQLPLVTDIIAADLTTATISLTVTPMNIQNTDRFVILADERTTLNPNQDQVRNVTGFRRINQRSVYPITETGLVIPQTGALFLVAMSDQSTTANQPIITGNWRYRYINN